MRKTGVIPLLALYLVSCGYHFGYRAPAGARRVAVPLFRNETWPLRREIEFELTRAVRREILKRTDLQLVGMGGNGVEGPDVVIRATVRQFIEQPLTEQELDAIADSSIFLVVDVELVDARTGEQILRRPVSDSADFSVLRGQNIELARRDAIDQIAEEILLLMEDWGPMETAPAANPTAE